MPAAVCSAAARQRSLPGSKVQPRRLVFASLLQPLDCELTDRIEHAEARGAVAILYTTDQAMAHQCTDDIEQLVLPGGRGSNSARGGVVVLHSRGQRLDGFERPAAGKDSQQPKDTLLLTG